MVFNFAILSHSRKLMHAKNMRFTVIFNVRRFVVTRDDVTDARKRTVLNSIAGDWTLTEEARDVLRALDEAVDGASGLADLTDSDTAFSLTKSVSRGVQSPPVPPPPPPPPAPPIGQLCDQWRHLANALMFA